ncbi:CDK9 [Lepeophtheirus salmonis]|uniref:CDK9 n=1 Tax=Lepeophtheirus salmonis TaxID=72036 RepID=A0A7R8CIZ4_LEPSM|nr:CDK9 [Lepeophtheirus salmonis]CAF2799491.1 CDK9 [Lepeophtheirus salmonis]
MTTVQYNGSNIPNSSQKGIIAADKDRYIENSQGTFGEVFKARLRADKSKIVALKKVLMENEKERFPITALRKIRILQLLKHDNIVNLYEICQQYSCHNKTTFYLVFEFCEHDLAGLLSNVKVQFSLGEIKKVMQQILEGLFYIHANKIIHRDMKAANILITRQGVLKLADFGLARAISINKNGQPNRYTNRVVTLWYRPPELLLGERNYGPPVDLWGAGCIMAEMLTRSPIMQGNTEQHQFDAHCSTLWRFDSRERLKPYVKDPYACDLIDKLLGLDPSRRMDSDSALERTLSNHSSSMFEYLASRRGGNIHAQQVQQAAAAQKPPNNEGYTDMVY